MSDVEVLAESHAEEAAHASAISKEADLKAQAAQMESAVINAMRQVFGPLQVKSEEDQMHILLPKIPLLCLNVEKMGADIKVITKTMNEWKDEHITKQDLESTAKELATTAVTKLDFELLKQQSDLTNKIVLTACGIILVAVLAALVGLVVMK